MQSGMGVELRHYVIDECLRLKHLLIEIKA
jgi:hypothetical protein